MKVAIVYLYRCTVELEVRGIAGGVWTFPITVDALESKPDDIIVIEAQGLNKETTVGFRLTSMEKYEHKNHILPMVMLPVLVEILFHLLPMLFLLLMYSQYIQTLGNYLPLAPKEVSFVSRTNHQCTERTTLPK